jgi:hypothetical protein
MLSSSCDLCGKPKWPGDLAKHGALALCSVCAGLFGHPRSAEAEDPGSLAAVAVAKVADDLPPADRPSERCTHPVERDECPGVPTIPVPAQTLANLVSALEDRCARPTDGAPQRPQERTASASRSRRSFGHSTWGRGVVAVGGIALAVMLAFFSLNAPLPRGAGVPDSFARDEVRATRAAAHGASPLPAMDSTEERAVVETVTATKATEPANALGAVPPAESVKPTKPASPSRPVKPRPRPASSKTPDAIGRDPGVAANAPTATSPGESSTLPIPDFGGRD